MGDQSLCNAVAPTEPTAVTESEHGGQVCPVIRSALAAPSRLVGGMTVLTMTSTLADACWPTVRGIDGAPPSSTTTTKRHPEVWLEPTRDSTPDQARHVAAQWSPLRGPLRRRTVSGRLQRPQWIVAHAGWRGCTGGLVSSFDTVKQRAYARFTEVP
jgi:hypothetical protein